MPHQDRSAPPAQASARVLPKVSPGFPGSPRWPPEHPSPGPGGPRDSGDTGRQDHFWQHPT
eukprot:6556454-Pyramimonas_sp.AAC.1